MVSYWASVGITETKVSFIWKVFVDEVEPEGLQNLFLKFKMMKYTWGKEKEWHTSVQHLFKNSCVTDSGQGVWEPEQNKK